MLKKGLYIVLLALVLVLVSCTTDKTDKTEPTEPTEGSEPTEVLIEKEIKSISGLEDIVITEGVYFHPLRDVVIKNEYDENISYLFEVSGQVNYGVPGTYTLNYQLTYGEDVIDETRIVTVNAGTIMAEPVSRNQLQNQPTLLGDGSFNQGVNTSIDHPVNPRFIANHLKDKAIPSNGWWTSLLVQNYGGGNGIYTNPLRSSFTNRGAEITNPGAGFVQYWNPDGFNTMANFSLVLPDMYLKTTDLNEGYETYVVDYSDTSVAVSMRNLSSLEDKMVLTYQQGSPYVFVEVSDPTRPYISLVPEGAQGIELYTIDGVKISDSNYQGDGFIIRYINKHIGYETSRPAQVGQPIFGDRYFLVSTPEGSSFNITTNRVGMNLGVENVYSVSAINALADAPYFHQRAYQKPLFGNVSYDVNDKTSILETYYHLSTQSLKAEKQEVIQYLLPHHETYSDVSLTNYEFETVRGFLKLMVGSTFTTSMSFHGLLPAMTLPSNEAFSEIEMATYLNDLGSRTEINDPDNFLNDEGPYWNGKALYPLAQGLIIASQMGDDDLVLEFISKLRYLLSDWFTYDGATDEKYLYYNEQWGTVYYSNNDFNTATELSDHAFTHGYLIYASSVLSMYDETFMSDYGDMVDLLLSDYMHPYKDDYKFQYLRSFDKWAGHTWAHGFGTFAEGNNIESSSEAIQSWVGGYLWALQKGDKTLRDAAIYGFMHELTSAKIYMFDYEDNVFKPNYEAHASVAGMIWGGKYDYATWFGANPTFIYGIQWLPNGEYLSNYALNDQDRETLTLIYADYLKAKNQVIDTWFANMWSIQALINPDIALQQFDASKILNDDYPSDLSQTYYLINGLKTFGQRTTDYIMELHPHVTSSIYINAQNEVFAMIWNATDDTHQVFFVKPGGIRTSVSVEPRSFTSFKLS
ncbi:MAG: hypothetical protein CVV61_06555 [Tenericutes bacterium HGW-Tenericutes-6]|nr:MAG: hypothetical protein CVV61_06555 [Tenericutes bacterium HGW-Tenericutes-6]